MIRAEGGTALSVLADLNIEKDCQKAVARIVAELGGRDVLVNNLGVDDRRRPEERDADVARVGAGDGARSSTPSNASFVAGRGSWALHRVPRRSVSRLFHDGGVRIRDHLVDRIDASGAQAVERASFAGTQFAERVPLEAVEQFKDLGYEPFAFRRDLHS